jgi:hypothetical protein
MSKKSTFALGILCGLFVAAFLPFAFGEIDYLRLENGRPLFARLYAPALGGGSVWYKGFGYDIYDYNSISEHNSATCVGGPSINYSMPYYLVDNHQDTSVKTCRERHP